MSDEKIRHTAGPWVACDMSAGSRYSAVGVAFLQPEDRDGNGRLVALAPTAPHTCDVPNCPGMENKRRLEEVNAVTGAPGFSRMESGGEWLEQQRRLEAYPALRAALEVAATAIDAALMHSSEGQTASGLRGAAKAIAQAKRMAGEHE